MTQQMACYSISCPLNYISYVKEVCLFIKSLFFVLKHVASSCRSFISEFANLHKLIVGAFPFSGIQKVFCNAVKALHFFPFTHSLNFTLDTDLLESVFEREFITTSKLERKSRMDISTQLRAQ